MSDRVEWHLTQKHPPPLPSPPLPLHSLICSSMACTRWMSYCVTSVMACPCRPVGTHPGCVLEAKTKGRQKQVLTSRRLRAPLNQGEQNRSSVGE